MEPIKFSNWRELRDYVLSLDEKYRMSSGTKAELEDLAEKLYEANHVFILYGYEGCSVLEDIYGYATNKSADSIYTYITKKFDEYISLQLESRVKAKSSIPFPELNGLTIDQLIYSKQDFNKLVGNVFRFTFLEKEGKYMNYNWADIFLHYVDRNCKTPSAYVAGMMLFLHISLDRVGKEEFEGDMGHRMYEQLFH